MKKKLRVQLLGKSGRLDAMAAALWRSDRLESLDILAEVRNPGLVSHASTVEIGDSANPARVIEHARKYRPDFAVIGPEEPLAAGVVDELWKILGIPAVGPTQALAKIETSKSFARELIARHGIGGNPEHRIFRNADGVRDYLERLGSFVVKPDGLTGGKGVKVSGDHLHSVAEGEDYCLEILAGGGIAIVEEKLDGEEFSFQSFCDGETVVDMMPVQDHKRLLDGDAGPNTGGMGSYTCENHLLPFLTADDIALASRINRAVANALKKEIGPYKGILYGGFMLTARGLRVIEYNARFGDPEALNVLPLLETDFLDICEAIVTGTLDRIDVRFAHKATVCKYVVPKGYPTASARRAPVVVPISDTDSLRVYQGAVQDENGTLMLTGSRAIGVVGIGDTLAQAERIAEDAACRVEGPVFHRRDVGTQALVQSRVDHMARIRSNAGSSANERPAGERAWAQAM